MLIAPSIQNFLFLFDCATNFKLFHLLNSGNAAVDRHNIKDHLDEGKLHCFARMLVSFLVKVLSFLRTLRPRLDKSSENIHSSEELDLAHKKYSTTEAIKKDYVTVCKDRLHKVELILNELSSKPSGIPPEKERMILDLMDRIKSVELDVPKTNTVRFFSGFFSEKRQTIRLYTTC